MRAPGKTPVFATLPLSLPWHVYLMLAEAAFMTFKWVLPSLCTTALCTRAHVQGWSAMAWLSSGLFLLLAAACLANRKRYAAATAGTGR